MSQLRIVIADDHALVRSGLRSLLETQADMVVVGEAADGVEVVECCRRLRPQVVVLDLKMPGRGGIGAIEDIRKECPDTRVVVLTMHDDDAYVRVARLAGAAGYVFKQSLATELIGAIRAVQAGKTFFPDVESIPIAARESRPLDLLSEREREVLALIALGHTSAEIAGKLHISVKTVESHRAHIVGKLGLHTRADLVRFAIEHGLLEV